LVGRISDNQFCKRKKRQAGEYSHSFKLTSPGKFFASPLNDTVWEGEFYFERCSWKLSSQAVRCVQAYWSEWSPAQEASS